MSNLRSKAVKYMPDSRSPHKEQNNPLNNGQYEVMGLMHVYIKKGREETGIARQNIVEVTVKN